MAKRGKQKSFRSRADTGWLVAAVILVLNIVLAFYLPQAVVNLAAETATGWPVASVRLVVYAYLLIVTAAQFIIGWVVHKYGRANSPDTQKWIRVSGAVFSAHVLFVLYWLAVGF